ncbi:MAG: hypothetical protein V1732_03590 [Patescibacteria group bacterium]|nr:hypothetical protein [Patescibacteria group bacterium]MBU4142353.1 hypothetical protein [Patescibacteria group bacterium]
MFSFIVNFFYGWYVDDTINFWNWFVNCLKTLDRTVGLIGNIQNWTSPLYGDYSYIGVVAGPIFRTLRIFFGIALYAAIAIFSAIVYLFWIILPIAVVIMVFLNLLVLIKAPEAVYALGGELLNLFIR